MEYWVISDITLLRHYYKLTIHEIQYLDPPLDQHYIWIFFTRISYAFLWFQIHRILNFQDFIISRRFTRNCRTLIVFQFWWTVINEVLDYSIVRIKSRVRAGKLYLSRGNGNLSHGNWNGNKCSFYRLTQLKVSGDTRVRFFFRKMRVYEGPSFFRETGAYSINSD